MFFVESSGNSHLCPVCQGILRYRDSRPRIRKKEGGVKERLMIRRFRCQNCHSYHNELPDCLVPYKHYESLGAAVPEEGISPLQEWNRAIRPLTFLDAAVVSEAFLHHEQRKVDKGACISFRGKRYETKASLIGHTVEISYDPAAPEQITISYQGMEPFTAAPLKIGSYCDKRPTLPASMQEQTPTTSRFLDALEVRHKQNQQQMADAISFASYRKEADD